MLARSQQEFSIENGLLFSLFFLVRNFFYFDESIYFQVAILDGRGCLVG